MILFIMIAGAVISGYLASQKHRNVGAWVVCGALFPLIGVIAVACVPPLDTPALPDGKM